jgi:hypothetical protein
VDEAAWVKLLQDVVRLPLLSWGGTVPALWGFLRENSQALSHLALVFGVPFLGWRAWAADRQARVAYLQAKTAEQGHLTDRFTKAIEQLGSEKMAVRLGAIYALERLSKDSQQDDWTIMEVLSAYIRDNAPWSPGHEQRRSFKTDIQASLTVLGRRHEEARARHEAAERYIDLRLTDLRGANLRGHIWKARSYRARTSTLLASRMPIWSGLGFNVRTWNARSYGPRTSKAQSFGTRTLKGQVSGKPIWKAPGCEVRTCRGPSFLARTSNAADFRERILTRLTFRLRASMARS